MVLWRSSHPLPTSLPTCHHAVLLPVALFPPLFAVTFPNTFCLPAIPTYLVLSYPCHTFYCSSFLPFLPYIPPAFLLPLHIHPCHHLLYSLLLWDRFLGCLLPTAAFVLPWFPPLPFLSYLPLIHTHICFFTTHSLPSMPYTPAIPCLPLFLPPPSPCSCLPQHTMPTRFPALPAPPPFPFHTTCHAPSSASYCVDDSPLPLPTLPACAFSLYTCLPAMPHYLPPCHAQTCHYYHHLLPTNCYSWDGGLEGPVYGAVQGPV